MPNGDQPAPVHDEIAFRTWVAAKLNNMPCAEHAKQIDKLRLNGATAAGRRALLRQVLPWVFAALGLGVGGKSVLDAAAPPAAPPPPITAR